MKILLITTLFPHSTGGIGDYSYRLARHLSNGDDELHVLTSEDSHIIKTCNFCNIHAVIRSWSVAEYRSVLNIVGQVRPDIVHIQHDTTPYKNKKLLLNVLPLLIRIFYRKIRIVTTIHEFREHRLRWKLRALPMMIASDKCVFVDKWDMETARRQFGFIPSDKLTWIPIAANITPSDEDMAVSKPEIRRKLGLNVGDTLLFYFGLISPQKGVDILLDAFAKIMYSSDNLKLIMISDIFSKEFKRNLYQEMIVVRVKSDEFAGRVLSFEGQDEKTISLYMRSADIAVLPFKDGVSFQRGTFLACLAHGLPVVTTAAKDFYPPFIVNGRDAVLIDSEDKEAISKELLILIEDTAARSAMGSNAAFFYKEHFAWHSIAAKTRALYQEVLS